MTTPELFILIAFAALIHASFQLSVSVLTVMSGHALGKKTAHARLLRLTMSYVAGAVVMIALSVSALALVIANFSPTIPLLVWSATCGLIVGVGVAVWLFYYRYRTSGTILWIPRPMAEYLSSRARATKIAPEAFALGQASVVGELVFIGAPILVAALLLAHVAPPLQLAGLVLYTVIAAAPLMLVVILLGAGHSLAVIQRWRERNKVFLQFAAGTALVVLGGYLYIQMVVSTLATGSSSV